MRVHLGMDLSQVVIQRLLSIPCMEKTRIIRNRLILGSSRITFGMKIGDTCLPLAISTTSSLKSGQLRCGLKKLESSLFSRLALMLSWLPTSVPSVAREAIGMLIVLTGSASSLANLVGQRGSSDRLLLRRRL